MHTDYVCELCGSDTIVQELDVTTIADTSRVYEYVPVSCSNGRCEYASGFSIAGGAIPRSEYSG